MGSLRASHSRNWRNVSSEQVGTMERLDTPVPKGVHVNRTELCHVANAQQLLATLRHLILLVPPK